jgi:hypothetical protein
MTQVCLTKINAFRKDESIQLALTAPSSAFSIFQICNDLQPIKLAGNNLVNVSRENID